MNFGMAYVSDPQHSTLRICMPIKRCPEDFQGINQVPWTFKQIQPYSPVQESSDYKTFDTLVSQVSFRQWKGLRMHRE